MQLRSLRRKLGIPIGEAAEGIGIGKATLSRIERREREPTGAVLLLIDLWVSGLRDQRNLGPEFRIDWTYLIRSLREKRKRNRRRRAAA